MPVVILTFLVLVGVAVGELVFLSDAGVHLLNDAGDKQDLYLFTDDDRESMALTDRCGLVVDTANGNVLWAGTRHVGYEIEASVWVLPLNPPPGTRPEVVATLRKHRAFGLTVDELKGDVYLSAFSVRGIRVFGINNYVTDWGRDILLRDRWFDAEGNDEGGALAIRGRTLFMSGTKNLREPIARVMWWDLDGERRVMAQYDDIVSSAGLGGFTGTLLAPTYSDQLIYLVEGDKDGRYPDVLHSFHPEVTFSVEMPPFARPTSAETSAPQPNIATPSEGVVVAVSKSALLSFDMSATPAPIRTILYSATDDETRSRGLGPVASFSRNQRHDHDSDL